MRRFLTADWRMLAMLSWQVEPALLRPLVPRGTELDAWRGHTYASVVGFRFLRTRVLGVPVPFHRDFDEVNLRFYVRREVAGEQRRGVVFVRELVPRAAIAWLARAVYDEPYLALPMRHTLPEPGSSGGGVSYAWRAGGEWQALEVAISGAPQAIADGSREEFITEHYWGYTARRDGSSSEYRVEHPRWRVFATASPRLRGDVARVWGGAFAGVLAGEPDSAFVADGSPVTVYQGTPIAGPA